MTVLWSRTFGVKLGDRLRYGKDEIHIFEPTNHYYASFPEGMLVKCDWMVGVRTDELTGAIDAGLSAALQVFHYGRLIASYIEFRLPKHYPGALDLPDLLVEKSLYELPIGAAALRLRLDDWKPKTVLSRRRRGKNIELSCPTKVVLAAFQS